MSFTENFLKELEKKKKKIDNTEVKSPFAGGNKTSQQKPTGGDDFTSLFLEELEKAAEKEEKRQNWLNKDDDDIAPVTSTTKKEEDDDVAPTRPLKRDKSGELKEYSDLLEEPKGDRVALEKEMRKQELKELIASLESELDYDKPLLEQAVKLGWVQDVLDLFTPGTLSERGVKKKDLEELKKELKALEGEGDTSKRTYFQSGAFEDGLQFEDLFTAPIGTVTDAAAEVGKGFFNMFEGVSDAILHGAGYVADAVGADKAGDYLHNEADYESAENLFGAITPDSTQDNSLLGDKSRGIAQGLGNYAAIYATGGVGKALGLGTFGLSALTTGTIFSSSLGRGISEARNHEKQNMAAIQERIKQLDTMFDDGELNKEQYDTLKTYYTNMAKGFKVSDGEAIAHGLMAGTAEALSEMLFGGLGRGVNAIGFNKGLIGADDWLAKKAAGMFKSQITKNFVEFGIKASAEGVEEILAGIGNAYAKKWSYLSEEDIDKLIADENLLESFIAGTVVSGIAQSGYVPGTNQGGLKQSIQSGTDFITGLTANEQAVIDKEYEKRIAEAEKNGKVNGKKKNEIYEQVLKDLDKGGISTDTIEEVLGGDSYKTYQDTVTKEDSALKPILDEAKSVNDEFKSLNQLKTGERTGEQSDRLEELRARKTELQEQIKETKKTWERDFLQKKYKNEAFEIARGSRLEESYRERARRGQAFAADLSKYNEKQRAVVQKAIDSGILNNTNRAHEFVDLVAKIAADKGVSFDFTNNEKLKNSGFAIDGKTVNGYVTKDGITINIQSSKSLNSVVGHEIAHVLEGTELYTELQNAIVEYAKAKGDYQGRYDTLAKLYETVEGADINAELTADLVGDYLFTDENFINNLSVKHRNVFQKVYDEIKYLCKVATAGTKEARELEKVKRAFEKAYQAQKNTAQDGGTKYALSKDINGNVFVDVTEDIFDANNGESVARTIQRVISERFNNLIDVHGQKIQINKTTNDEFRRSESVNHLLNSPSQAYDDKLKTIANADEILSAAKNWIGEEIKHVRKDDIVEFARGNVMYRVGDNGYVADVIVGTRKNGAAVLYDLVNIYDKKITEAPVTMASNDNSQRRQDASAKPIVSQKENVVNRKFSLSTDSDGKQLSKQQAEYFKDSKVRDDNGNLIVVYHGTENGGFTIFDPRYSDDKSTLFFTDSPELAATYSGGSTTEVNLPAPKQGLAKRLETGKTKGKGQSGLYKGYLNFKNPLVIDAKGRNWNEISLTEDEKALESRVYEDGDNLILEHKVDGVAERKTFTKQEVMEAIDSFYDELALAGERANEAFDVSYDELYSEMYTEILEKFKGNPFLEYLFKYPDTPDRMSDMLSDVSTAMIIWKKYPSRPGEQNNNGVQNKTIDSEGNRTSTHTTRDIAKKAKREGHDGVIIKNVRDVGATPTESIDAYNNKNVYIAFNSNQVKSVNNTNPTSNRDIRYSLSTKGEAQQAYGNYNVYGKDIALEGALSEDVAPVQEDIAPVREDVAPVTADNVQNNVQNVTNNVQEMFPDDFAPIAEEEAAMIENEALDSITDEDAPPETEMPYYEQRDTGTIDNESLKGISERASEYLGLNRTERATLEEVIQNYSQNENLTRDDLYSEMKDKFSVIEETMPNEDVIQIKKDLRATKLYVSDEVKADFGKGAEDGYTKFLRSNFGRLRIVKDISSGVPVDSAYEELSSLYPSYFPDDIINPADQLRRIAEMAAMPSEDFFPMQLSDAEIEAVADMVYTDISDYMNEMRLNSATEASYAPISDVDAPVEPEVETENKVLSVREMYEQKKNNYKETLAAYEAGKEKSYANFQEAIGKKLNEYNALKNKNTQRANTLLQQIERLRMRRDNVQADYTNRIAKQQAKIEAFESKDFSEFENNVLAVRRRDLHKQIVDDTKAQFEAQGYDLDEVLKNAKDLSTFTTVDNIPQRVMEKALGWKEGHILSDITVNKVAQNETEGIKWLNTITDRKNGLLANLVKDYGIKPGSKESAAAQMYAEGFYVDKNNDIIKYGDEELAKDFPDSKVRENIKALSKDERVRQFYDDTLKAINESRARNAYPEIPKLDNYFLHFRAMEDTFSRLGLPFNPNDIRAKDLPTDLNGVTADLKPGQPYFASAKHRMGQRTSFDLLGGLEKYATSAKNQIYHIDDIQTLRAIRNYIADTYGQAKGLESLDSLSEEEAQERIKEVYGSHLSTFAKFLNEEANVLAGKTALIDRGLEGVIGRRAMTFMDAVNRQVGSNMIGYNISSALTNLIAPVQAFAKTNKADFVKGFAQTVSNRIQSIKGKGDGFTEESPVVIRRKGAERYYRNAWQKLSDPGYALMGAVDNFSTELIARAKYNELTRKGMDSETAHVEADKWVSRLMGDRSLGQQPQIYNSKMLGLVTKFQLEVRNQLDSQFYDTIQEAKASTEDIQNGLERNAKKAAKISSTFFTLAVGQHLFGKAFESIAGYNPAFDIISVMIKAFGFDDDEDSEDTVLDNIEQAFFELMGDMPYTSILEGGRIPIASALPIEELYKGKDQYGNDKSRWETLLETLPYYTMPGGYGQLKKTTQGLGMFDEDLPISGSYTDSGKLRYPVEDDLWKRVQAGLFGQYASENARDYFNNERKALDKKQTQEFIDSGISIQEYWEYREGLSGLKTLNEKADYINSLDLPVEVKNLFINNLSDRKEDIDLSGMGGYTDFNEYDFATKNPEKYEWLKANGISVAEYEGSDEETKEEYDFAFKYPEKYVVSKAVGGYKSYKTYSSDLYDIKADKDEDGKSISGSRKEKVIDYINNMDIDYGQKIILFKNEYPADDTYNNDIIEYLNERDDISFEEMVTILKELGFTVKGDQVYWD